MPDVVSGASGVWSGRVRDLVGVGELSLGDSVEVVPTTGVGRMRRVIEAKVTMGCGMLFCLFGGVVGLINYFETMGSASMYIVSGVIMMIGFFICMISAVILGWSVARRVETASA